MMEIYIVDAVSSLKKIDFTLSTQLYFKKMGNQGSVSAFFQKEVELHGETVLLFKKLMKRTVQQCFFLKEEIKQYAHAGLYLT